MMENPFVLTVGSIMVLLLVLAWMFPNVRWLEPFRALRLPPPPAPRTP